MYGAFGIWRKDPVVSLLRAIIVAPLLLCFYIVPLRIATPRWRIPSVTAFMAFAGKRQFSPLRHTRRPQLGRLAYNHLLDLDKPVVTNLHMGPRILSALFQAALGRHWGTYIFNFAQIDPAVQFSLARTIYIAVFPHHHRHHVLSIYPGRSSLDELSGLKYILYGPYLEVAELWFVVHIPVYLSRLRC
ncbi:hypothetical protein MAPG_02324 [Magnaporthiopsis poae ATCC 64411]|uniref:Uncharacterized protein n=1 Tax=Magnaporthiopsis poae (strain ATCC 64411 / 73-15) TaxID=644358 RepID=A0A0C4DR24_MAGP6|nr:hypothetical protein MAPG_02324 [Magnaporthiopsis poae ATCC 64411]